VQVFAAQAKAAGVDLTPVQFAALAALEQSPGLDQAGLAAAIAYDRATIGGVVDRLVSKGYVARTVSDPDRRARVRTLPGAGAQVLAALRPVVEAFQAEILEGLDAEERRTFLALARRVAEG
jgi:DNA-binding MarR family transcriptional regulator